MAVRMLTPDEKNILLHAARESIRAAARGNKPYEIPEPLRTAALLEQRACFVTIHKHGELRGCVGQVHATRPLHEAVAHSACSCATRDPRFPAVTADEVDELSVEVSVLTPPAKIHALNAEELLGALEPGKHGVLLEVDGRTSTFLPQVWESLPDKEQFMDRLSRKAGLSASAWKQPGARVSLYEVEPFEAGPAPVP